MSKFLQWKKSGYQKSYSFYFFIIIYLDPSHKVFILSMHCLSYCILYDNSEMLLLWNHVRLVIFDCYIQTSGC
jgi:hypothetical protein